MSTPLDHELRGPFYTRAQAAAPARMRPAELAAMPGALRINGPFGTEEVYPGFQFQAGGGFVPDLPGVVALLADRLSGLDAAEWLTTTLPSLGSRSPVDWLRSGRPAATVLELAGGETGAAFSAA